ncbi:MAG: WS/DGAT domain-containing protein [Mycobacterium sp.]
MGIIAIAGLAASTHLDRVAHPACNLAISNVPGAREPRYLNDGARLVGVYPVSALAASVGLNATLTSYHDHMDFGFVANAAAIDNPTELARHTLRAYQELTEAAGKKQAGPQLAFS